MPGIIFRPDVTSSAPKLIREKQNLKKTQADRLEMKKYNPALKRHTVHKEIK